MLPKVLVLAISVTFMTALAQQSDWLDADLATGRVDAVWRLVDQRYWDLGTVPVDWAAIRRRYLAEADGVTTMTLTHEGFATAEACDEHTVGWGGSLDRLEQFVQQQ